MKTFNVRTNTRTVKTVDVKVFTKNVDTNKDRTNNLTWLCDEGWDF